MTGIRFIQEVALRYLFRTPPPPTPQLSLSPSHLLNASYHISFTLRWKGDCGGKKQMWFPANYVEEISPSAAEPDRTVRIKRAHTDTGPQRHICIVKSVTSNLEVRPCLSSVRHAPSQGYMTYLDYNFKKGPTSSLLILLFFCQAGDDREQPSGRSAERKCGRVFLSDRCVASPLPVRRCAAGLQSRQSPCQRADLFFCPIICFLDLQTNVF